MRELQRIYVHPLTGARANDERISIVGPTGLDQDRAFVPYDPNDPSVEERILCYPRISQKQLHNLAQISAQTSGYGLNLSHETYGALHVDNADEEGPADLFVNEFGDETPAYDAGDEVAEYLQAITGHSSVRLAQKTSGWMMGEGIKPADRKNAPVHIVAAESLAAISEQTGVNIDDIRLRPRANLVVAGFEPLSEATWLGKCIRIGDLTLKVAKLTERCPVPGTDQKTGEKMMDVQKLYPTFPRAPGGRKPTLGVYAYPVLSPGKLTTIVIGQSVELLDAA